MTKDEALKLAMEALKNAYWPTESDLMPAHNTKECAEAITAIREALAQPEQEPCKTCNGTGEVQTGIGMMVCDDCHGITYTTPPQREWTSLTQEEFVEACQMAERGNYLVAFQHVQAKLKDKNVQR